MRLAVFGDSPHSIQHLVRQGLSVGYSIATPESSIVRLRKHKRLTTFAACAPNHSMAKILQQSDAALCILQNSFKTLEGESISLLEDLIANLHTTKVKRLVVFSYIENFTPQETPTRSTWYGKFRNIFAPTAPRNRGVIDLLQSTKLDWTVIGHPIDRTKSENENLVGNPSTDVFFGELAKYMISQVSDARHLRKVLVFSGSN